MLDSLFISQQIKGNYNCQTYKLVQKTDNFKIDNNREVLL